jgi:hypothetical protein
MTDIVCEMSHLLHLTLQVLEEFLVVKVNFVTFFPELEEWNSFWEWL